MNSDNLRALPDGTRISDYQIQSVLGFGGFGITYLALDAKLDLRVAIKEYFPREFAVRAHTTQVRPAGSNEDRDTFKWGLERFLQEARVLARFKHPNIVSVTRFFEENGTAYLVMDYCEGRPLDKIFEDEGKLSFAQLRLIIPPLLDALERVHRASLLHRDIKPANIFLREDNSPVLLDFGAARHDLIEHSRSVTSLVTANYSSIEQYSTHSKQGPWSDIYSLGATLYRAVTGLKLQDAPDRMLEDQVKSAVSLKERGYPKALLQAIDSAIKVRPQDRPQSVAEWKELFGGSLEQDHRENLKTEARLSPDNTDQIEAPSISRKTTDNSFFFAISFVGVIGVALIVYIGSGSRAPDVKTEPVSVPQPPIAKSKSNEERKEVPIAKLEPPKVADKPTIVAGSLPNCIGNDPSKFHACIGTRTTSGGTRYTGEFQNGKETGTGEAVFVSGNRYSGGFRDGRFNGKGKFYFASGDVLEANYVAGSKEGPSTYRWRDGSTAEIIYKNDKETNPQTIRYASGGVYIGDINFETGNKEGKGTYRFKGGNVYIGDWRSDKRHGFGIEYDGSGTIIRNGQWHEGEFLGGQKVPL